MHVCFSITETCRVVDLQYETGPPTLCQITLRPTMRKIASDKPSDHFDFLFKYHDMPDVIDFIVLKQKVSSVFSVVCCCLIP